MRIDCHIHTTYGDVDREAFLSRLNQAGIDGGIVLSHGPSTLGGSQISPQERIENVLEWTEGHKWLFPFYFIDPTGEKAMDEVELAASMGIMGFKIICNTHYPSDPRAVPVYQQIANKGLPILFHSGILYDGKNASGNYNKPTEFEVLLSVDNLRFALAHVSWPWTDECIAVYGKFNNSLKTGGDRAATAEMFVDITPGTPFIYRKSMLERLLLTGYDIENNVIWGVDSNVNNYGRDYALQISEFDDNVFNELQISEEIQNKIYFENVLRFIGALK
ncbi:MAG TPA: amidohydrolase family protein [Clostridia bacterium]|nr:amidohydrolase family protein [Clostridia bacterium]